MIAHAGLLAPRSARLRLARDQRHPRNAPCGAFLNSSSGDAYMETMFHRMRSAPVVLPWLTIAALAWGTEAAAAQPSSKTSPEIDISPARSASLISTCRNEAERRAAPPKGLHSVRWDETAHPQVMRAQTGANVVARVSLAGWARSGDDWVPIAVHCKFEKGQRAVVSVDRALVPPDGRGLDLSRIPTLPEAPARPDAKLPSISELPALKGPPSEANGSSTIAPTFQETTPVPPYLNKGQDFLHDHRFGIELRAPF